MTPRTATHRLAILQAVKPTPIVGVELECWKASVLGALEGEIPGLSVLRRPIRNESERAISAELRRCVRVMLLAQCAPGRWLLYWRAAWRDPK